MLCQFSWQFQWIFQAHIFCYQGPVLTSWVEFNRVCMVVGSLLKTIQSNTLNSAHECCTVHSHCSPYKPPLWGQQYSFQKSCKLIYGQDQGTTIVVRALESRVFKRKFKIYTLFHQFFHQFLLHQIFCWIYVFINAV